MPSKKGAGVWNRKRSLGADGREQRRREGQVSRVSGGGCGGGFGLGSHRGEDRGRGRSREERTEGSGTKWEMSLEEEKRERQTDCLGFPVCDGDGLSYPLSASPTWFL